MHLDSGLREKAVAVIRDRVTTFARSLELLRHAASHEALLLLGCLVLQGLIPALLIWVTKTAVDLATTALASGNVTFESVLPVGLLWAGGLLAESSLAPWAAAIQGNLNEKLTAHVNILLMKKADSLPDLATFESSEFYDQLQVLRDQATYQPLNLLVYLTNGIREAVITVSVLALLATVAFWMPIALVLAALPYAIVQLRLQRASWETMVWSSPNARLMQYFTSLLLTDAYAKESRLFGFGPWLIRRYQSAFQETHEPMRRIRTRQAAWANALVGLSAVVNGSAFTWVIWRTASGALGPGSILLLVQSLLFLQQNLLALAHDGTMMSETQRYFGSLFRFVDWESPLGLSGATRPVPPIGASGIRLERVSFAYPDGRHVLRAVDMTLAPGKVTALVGENGAGKSTVVKLLARFYDPGEGRVLIGGQDLRELDLTAWRKSIAAVFQDFGRYQLTLGENIAFSSAPLPPEAPATSALLHQSGLASVVAKLDNDLNAPIGRQFGGTELSGGEWQKVAIARALARREQAQLLILDEPTAALDPRSEAELYRQFAELAAGTTTLLITHRLGSVRLADAIYVLDDGRIVESGTHEELLNQDGLYATLWRLQAKSYEEASV